MNAPEHGFPNCRTVLGEASTITRITSSSNRMISLWIRFCATMLSGILSWIPLEIMRGIPKPDFLKSVPVSYQGLIVCATVAMITLILLRAFPRRYGSFRPTVMVLAGLWVAGPAIHNSSAWLRERPTDWLGGILSALAGAFTAPVSSVMTATYSGSLDGLLLSSVLLLSLSWIRCSGINCLRGNNLDNLAA